MKRSTRLAVVPALGVVVGLAAVLPAGASSHREAPLTSQDPVADHTDVYAFVSPDKKDTVTFVANFIPDENPAGGPNFYRFGDDVNYRINIDNMGDAVDNIVYEFRFETKIRNGNTFLYNTNQVTSPDDPDLNLYQTYTVDRIDASGRRTVGRGLTAPANVGPVSTPDYPATAAKAVQDLAGDQGKVFAGPRDDPFFVDLGSIFDLGQLRPFLPAYKPAPRPAEAGRDALAGRNVHSIVLQVPIDKLTNDRKKLTGTDDPDAVIGVTSTAERRATRVLSPGKQMESGKFVQVSRLGNPLVNEVIIPLKDKDTFNGSKPTGDAQFLPYVRNPELAGLVTSLYGVPTPAAPRNDLVTVFLTGIPGLNQPPNVTPSEQLRLNMAVPPTAGAKPLGVLQGDNAGFPNGRRLADDVTDVALRAVAGGTPFTPEFNVSPNNDLGDGVNANDKPFLDKFPYVATPHQGYSYGDPRSKTTVPINP